MAKSNDDRHWCCDLKFHLQMESGEIHLASLPNLDGNPHGCVPIGGLFHIFGIRTPRSDHIASFSPMQPACDAVLMYGPCKLQPVKYALFPVWALALVSFRSSFKGLAETYNTQVELGNVVKLLVVAYMNVTQGSKIGRVPFWIFWSLLVLKCFYRIVTRHLASKTLWHSRSSELLQAYMGPDQPQSNFHNTCSPDGAMEGCKYLVYGESELENSCRINTTRDVNIDNLRSLLTLDIICQRHDVGLHTKWPLPCLDYSGVGWKEESYMQAHNKEKEGDLFNILEGDVLFLNNLFNILEWDVGFLRDFLFTNYPMIFSEGFLSLSSGLTLAALKFSVALWLSNDFFSVARHLSRNRSSLAHQHKLSATDLNVTGVAILFTAFSDGYEMFKYCFLPDWTRVLAVCSWLNKTVDMQNPIIKGIFYGITLSMSIGTRLFPRDFAHIDQYDFLQSFNNSACKCSLLHLLTMGMIVRKMARN
uniref:DUF4220 domain-containing protein n=1 Tax=Oryza punctata TaxID=4537 RepID=A0A0E0MH94_ORYPU